MKDLLLAILFIAVGLALPIRYLLYRLRSREAAETEPEVRWRRPNHLEISGTVGALLAGLALLSLALSPDEAEAVVIDGATGSCSVADGRSSFEGVEQRLVFVTTYVDHSIFVGAFSDSLGSDPKPTELGALWTNVESLNSDGPVQIEAEFITSNRVERSTGLSASAPDGSDALTADLSDQIGGIAQGILLDSPKAFGC
ncbi:MAG: hypothetical protein AAFQ43_02690, partial [Bacteroidota bacterium]